MATPEEQKLDLHFKEDLSAIFSLSFLYGPEVRAAIKPWTAVFYAMGSNLLDKQMRNRYTSYLLMQLEVNRGVLTRPFDGAPPEHISEPLAKVVDAEEYIRFFEKCEKFYLSKKHHVGGGDEPFQEHRMSPAEFLYRLPPISDGLIAYGACFSKVE
ncbi:hypothetical protein pipiens_012571 [Culex pipiens pipiens]|uniref:DUF4485 domain-containing protein n=1 Tax=Culex pipiens pipiens TaxID=38569 RepID=A0ABD1D1U3_CULPP